MQAAPAQVQSVPASIAVLRTQELNCTGTDSSTLRRKHARMRRRADVEPAMPGTDGKAVGAGVSDGVGDTVVGEGVGDTVVGLGVGTGAVGEGVGDGLGVGAAVDGLGEGAAVVGSAGRPGVRGCTSAWVRHSVRAILWVRDRYIQR